MKPYNNSYNSLNNNNNNNDNNNINSNHKLMRLSQSQNHLTSTSTTNRRQVMINKKATIQKLPPMKNAPQISNQTVFPSPMLQVTSQNTGSKTISKKIIPSREFFANTMQFGSSSSQQQQDELLPRGIYSSGGVKKCEACTKKQGYIKSLQNEIVWLQNLANDLTTQLTLNGIKPKTFQCFELLESNGDGGRINAANNNNIRFKPAKPVRSQNQQGTFRISSSKGKRLGTMTITDQKHNHNSPQEHKQPLLKRKDSFFKIKQQKMYTKGGGGVGDQKSRGEDFRGKK